MDPNPASANGSGFDAALKALEDLDTSSDVGAPETPGIAIASGSILALDDEPADDALDGAPDHAASAGIGLVLAPVIEEEIAPTLESKSKQASVKFLAETPDYAAAASPVQPAAVAVPAAVVAPASKLTKIAIGLGLVSSLLSAVGLIVAERTIMSAQLVVADAREKQQQVAQAATLIKELGELREKQVRLLEQQQAQAASAPVTSAELQHRLDALQEGLLARDPVNKVVEAVNSGKAENNARFFEFGMKMARIEAALEKR